MLNHLLKYIIIISLLLNSVSSIAFAETNDGDVYDAPRDNIKFNEKDNRCDPGDLEMFDKKFKGIDFNFNNSNDYCLAYSTTTGATVVGSQIAQKFSCKASTNKFTPPTTPIPTPTWLLYAIDGTAKCAELTAVASSHTAACAAGNAFSCGYVTKANIDMTTCCAWTVSYSTLLAYATAIIATIYTIAKKTVYDAQVCGKDWQTWKNFNNKETGNAVWKNYKGPYALCLDVLFKYDGDFDEAAKTETTTEYEDVPNYYAEKYNNQSLKDYCRKYNSSKENYKEYSEINMIDDEKAKDRTIKNQFYREFIFGGMEYIDKSGDGCINPQNDDVINWNENLGYPGNEQRYYMTGPGENFTSNFACKRFSPYDAKTRQQAKSSFECCVNRARETLCLDNGKRDSVKFCKENSICKISDVDYKIYRSMGHKQFLCAKSYSLCPSNFTVALGTEQYDADDNGGYKNFCQYLNHCSKNTYYDPGYISSFSGKGASYISSACRDLRGDSQFFYNFEIDLPQIDIRNFTAPIAQCFSETVTNFLLNRAGDSKCASDSEFPTRNGICGDDEIEDYEYKKGQYLSEYPSILETIREHLKTAVKIALVLAIVFFGVSILLAMPKVPERKTILIFCLKLAFVMYFVIGDAWQSTFIEGVLGSSKVLSGLTFRVNDNYEEIYEERKSALMAEGDYNSINNNLQSLQISYSQQQAKINKIERSIDEVNREILELQNDLSLANAALLDAVTAKDDEQDAIINLINSDLASIENKLSTDFSSLDGDYDDLINSINDLNQAILALNISEIDLIPVPQKPYILTDENDNIILEAGQDKTTQTAGYIFDERQRITIAQEQYQRDLNDFNLAQDKLELANKKIYFDYLLDKEKNEIAQKQKDLNDYSQIQIDISQTTSALQSAKEIFNNKLLNIAYIKLSDAQNIANGLSGTRKTEANQVISSRSITNQNAKNGVYNYTDSIRSKLTSFVNDNINSYLQASQYSNKYYTISIPSNSSQAQKAEVTYSPDNYGSNRNKPYKFVYSNSNYRFSSITSDNFASEDSLKEISSSFAQSIIDQITADYRSKNCMPSTSNWGLFLICRHYAELVSGLNASFIQGYLNKLRDSIKDYENCASSSKCINPLTRNTLNTLLTSIAQDSALVDSYQQDLDTLYLQNSEYDPNNIPTQAQIDQEIREYAAKNDPPLTFNQAKSEIDSLAAQDAIVISSPPANSSNYESGITATQLNQLITDFAAENDPPLTFDEAKSEIEALAQDPAEQQRLSNLREPIDQLKADERLNILPDRIDLLDIRKQLHLQASNKAQLESQEAQIMANIQTRMSCFCTKNITIDSSNTNSLTNQQGDSLNCQGNSGNGSNENLTDCTDFDGNIVNAQAEIYSLICQINYKKHGRSVEDPDLENLSDDQKNKCKTSDYNDPNLFALNAELENLKTATIDNAGSSNQTFDNLTELEAEINRLSIELVSLENKYEEESTKLALKESELNSFLDGCQFPRYNYQDLNNYNHSSDEGNISNASRMDLSLAAAYPPGSEYLAIFDTLDCKIANALGFAPGVNVPNIILLIIGSFFTGGLGILFFVGAFLFGFFMISISIRALHLFVMSIIAMAVLIYVSPITIMCSLFPKTNDIFQKWYKSLMGIALQPMILFAYITIMINVFDIVITGSARFEEGKSDINQELISDSSKEPISGVEKKIICNDQAKDDSILCIFRVAEVKNLDGFEALGIIGIPIIFGINNAKIMTIFKATLTMYIFMQFVDKISSLANKLVGGSLKESTIGVSDMAQRTGGAARGIQKRGARAIKKWSSRGASAIAKIARRNSKTSAANSNESHSASSSGGIGTHSASTSTGQEGAGTHSASTSTEQEGTGTHSANQSGKDDKK